MTEHRLLAIDDDPDFQLFIKSFAEMLGCRAVVTCDPERFKRTYAELQPTVILVDLFMPDCDGIELIDWLAGEGCRARIVLISGHDRHYLGMAGKLCRDRGLPEVVTVSKPSSLLDLSGAMGVPADGLKPIAVPGDNA